ncbi:unnamed protein product [Caenorhabditis auriculariae]|uniref:Presenilin spe-4 n=1 Tax=Caenorhabditis auriculariae TaxID=2777116 RepID=A0A8S1H2U3_9PELO|nr:unnamed protein product [Caenorhabditis auriculariae]
MEVFIRKLTNLQLELAEFCFDTQLIWTVTSVMLNMSLTLLLWSGVYEMRTDSTLHSTFFFDSHANYTTGNEFLDGALNGLGTMALLGAVSFVMLGLALYDCRRIVQLWLHTSCILILFVISGIAAHDATVRFNPEITNKAAVTISIAFSLVYGFGGLYAFFFEAPLLCHQFYVIVNCSFISVFYLRAFPSHTAWFVLWSVVIWDFFAVLAPLGPLRKIQEKAGDYSNNVLRFLMFTANETKKSRKSGDRLAAGMEPTQAESVKDLINKFNDKGAQHSEEFVSKIRKRRESMGHTSSSSESSEEKEMKEEDLEIKTLRTAEEFSSSSASSSSANSESDTSTSTSTYTSSSSSSESESSESVTSLEECSEEWDYHNTAADALNDADSMRLGMGDFVFYSVLIGKSAAAGSLMATFGAGFGIIYGLILTLTVFSNSERTTPALPLSIIGGTVFHFLYYHLDDCFKVTPALVEIIGSSLNTSHHMEL